MTIESRYILVVSMDVDPAHEDFFNEVYDTEHVPYLLKVPGVHACTRAKGEPFQFAVGGEIKDVPAPSPVYTAIYEVDGPKVLTSPEWQKAVETGRWPSVRPHTSNRSHALFKVA
jgi:hypothetical protein